MGRVHAGFWTCLFFGDAEEGTLFSRLIETLGTIQDRGKPIYLTGGVADAAVPARACVFLGIGSKVPAWLPIGLHSLAAPLSRSMDLGLHPSFFWTCQPRVEGGCIGRLCGTFFGVLWGVW